MAQPDRSKIREIDAHPLLGQSVVEGTAQVTTSADTATPPTPTFMQRVIAGAIAGIPGGIAHAIVNEIDRKVFNYDTDDMLMVTGTFMDERGPARKLGFFMHLGFAMAFGIGYAVVLNPRDKHDAVIRGIGAGLVENSILWPLVGPLDKHHPYIRSGRLDKFNHPIALVQANLRHIALGYAIGKSYPAILRRIR